MIDGKISGELCLYTLRRKPVQVHVENILSTNTNRNVERIRRVLYREEHVCSLFAKGLLFSKGHIWCEA
jgi:hypothetical protein